MSQHPNVLIIGGGVIGLTTAYFLAKQGKRVEVIDRGEIGAEASWAGAGIIPPGNPERAATDYDRLRAVSSRMFSEFSKELRDATGIDNGYRVCGGFEFLDELDLASVPAWEAEGVPFEEVSPSRQRQLEAALTPTESPAYYFPGMAQARNPWHLRALMAICEQNGVTLRPGVGVESIVTRGQTVSSVRLAFGEVREADQYLIAAGAWCEQLLHPLGLTTGIHPVRGQIVLLKTPQPLLRRIVMVGKNYLVPREDGHVLIGATEEPEAGFQKMNTAAAIAGLIEFATKLVPELTRAEIVKCWAGLRPGSLDNLPSLGRVLDLQNLFLAGGHFRAGIQLSTGTAQVMSELLTGRTTSIPVASFRPGREPETTVHMAFRS
ncbi:MAG: glycine oxidase ThiO [Planctomycetes bacterium]|nr:glycine oxidase ThiO [Planctomycetota bacterium]